MHLRSACRVAAAQSAHDSFARVIGQRQGLLSQMGMDNGLGIIGVPPDHAGAGLGPWTFKVGSVDSFGEGFVYNINVLWLNNAIR